LHQTHFRSDARNSAHCSALSSLDWHYRPSELICVKLSFTAASPAPGASFFQRPHHSIIYRRKGDGFTRIIFRALLSKAQSALLICVAALLATIGRELGRRFPEVQPPRGDNHRTPPPCLSGGKPTIFISQPNSFDIGHPILGQKLHSG